MNILKKALFALLIVGSSLSFTACGDSKDVALGEKCKVDSKCVDGAQCVADADNAEEGTCKTVCAAADKDTAKCGGDDHACEQKSKVKAADKVNVCKVKK